MKFQRRRPLGRVLGLLLGPELKKAGVDVDALVAVPLHPKRLRLRTFNQADEIAMPIARRLKRPLLSPSVRRSIETRPQIELGRKDRMLGPLGSFSASRDLSGLRLAIVDDVITTGATVNALARVLKSAGAARVEAWSVARSIGMAESANQSTAKM
jgi:ComF family protein